jgi:hypothetical protein
MAILPFWGTGCLGYFTPNIPEPKRPLIGETNMPMLSQLSEENMTDEKIQKIVYSNIKDDNELAKYALIFGNLRLIEQRVNKAVELYQSKRVRKLIFTGGSEGISNENKEQQAEAEKMKELAITMGVDSSDIIVEDKSKNTIENVQNCIQLLGKEIQLINHIIIITSEFHLKRCYATLKKYAPHLTISMVAAKDGFSDSENWYKSDDSWNTGRSLATYEAKLLIQYAKEGKIQDLEIE